MEHKPNKDNSFFKETPVISADEKLSYEKLLAIKKKMVQKKILTAKIEPFQAPTALPIHKEGKSKAIPTTTPSTKEVSKKHSRTTSKQATVEKTKKPTPKIEAKVTDTKKSKEVQNTSLKQKTNKKSIPTPKKRPNLLPTTDAKKAVELPNKKDAANSTPPIPNKEKSITPFHAETLRNNFSTDTIPPKSKTPSTTKPISKPKTIENTSPKNSNTRPQKTSKQGTQIAIDKSPVANTKQANTNTKNTPPINKTMQPLDNQASSNAYGRGQGVHVTDSPYTEKPIPPDGKNLIPRSQEMHDILSYVPNWMVRWGNTVILLIIGGILVMSYYIKYPDVVKGMISVNSIAPPVSLVAKATGALTLIKEDKEIVAEGELIGIVKSTADYQDVLYIKEELSTFQEKLEKGWNFSYYELPTGLQLGDLQGAYSNLFIKLKEKKIQHQSTKNDKTRKQHINQQLAELEAIKKAKEKSLSIKYQAYSKAKSLLESRYKVLYEKGSISAEQMNEKESEVRNLLDRYQNDRMSFNEIKKRILDLNSNKVELDFQKADQNVLSTSSLFTAYESLKNSIHIWEETYLLKAPISGKLNLVQFTKNNMYLQREQVIANLVPILEETATAPTIIGELLMPTIGAGKAAIGQTVNVALNDYPKKQYGIVEGEVVSIADVTTLIPEGQGRTAYKVTVSFPKGLENTMKKEIQFKHNMQGRAEIITEDIRLIERFFHELRDLFGAK